MLDTITVDKNNTTPIYAQLADQIRLLIHTGRLEPGDGLPTVRSLAVELGINANTVARVYRDLQRDGLLRLERGLGTFVAEGARPEISHRDFEEVEARTRSLVRLARSVGLRSGELGQLVESLWKEGETDVSR